MRRAGDDVADFALVVFAIDHAGPIEREIAGRFRMHLRGARFDGVAQVDHGGRFVVIDDHQLGGVLRRGRGFGHHHRHRFAHIQHALAGQRRPERLDQFGALAAGQRRVAPGAFQSRRFDVGGGQHAHDALRRARLAAIDRQDAGVGMRRTHENGGRLLGQARVVAELPGAAHQGIVLDAQLGLAVGRDRIHGSSTGGERLARL